jgi:hypothetical protein
MDATSAIQIGLGVAVLLSFFASFLSAKTWKIGQILLVFMLIVSAGFFWFLAAAAMKVQASHGKRMNDLEAKLATEQKILEVLRDGSGSTRNDESVLATLQSENEAFLAGLRQLEVELHNVTYGRGRVWTDVKPNPPAADGTTSVAIEKPTPHGLHPNSIVYVFEQGTVAEGAHYLGEFTVKDAGEGTATLTPAISLTPEMQERLNATSKDWVIYELMPADSHDIFAAVPEAELRTLLPAGAVEEYLQDGKPADAQAPEDQVVTRKVDGEEQKFYQRKLHDYAPQFHELQLQFFVLQNLVEQKEKDNLLLEQTAAKTNADCAIRETEKANLTSDLEHFQKEVVIVKEHLEKVTAIASKVQTMAKTLLAEVQQQGTELGRLQLNALQQIEKNAPAPAPAESADTNTTTSLEPTPLEPADTTSALVGP